MIVKFRNREDSLLEKELFSSNKWISWVKNMEDNFIVRSIEIIKIHMFGDKVGFIHTEVSAKDKEGHDLPGITFIRGDSVSILTVLICEETREKYVVFTNQARVPVGKNVLESPAGMIDEGVASVKAIEELKEEVGDEIDFSESSLIELTSGYTSPGGIDEKIDIFAYEVTLRAAEIAQLQNKVTGNESENEFIQLDIVELEKALDKTESIITKLALCIYDHKTTCII